MRRLASVYGLTILTLASATEARQAGDVADAEDLLQRVTEAYRSAPALSDEVTLEIVGGNGTTQTMNMSLALDDNGEGEFSWGGWVFNGSNGHFYISRASLPGKYIQHPLEGNFAATLKSHAGDAFPVPHFALKYGSSTREIINGFGLGNLRGLTLDGYGMVEVDGERQHELKLSSPQGSINARIDPATMLLDSMELTINATRVQVGFDPKVYDELPRSLGFDTAGRREVDVIRLEVGDPAPDFELPTLDGDMVRLSDLRGNMVVIDFWATWCGPCLKAMPEIDKFAKWARGKDLPVRVYAIDSFEREQTDEAKRAKVEQLWKTRGFSFPTLLDFSMRVAQAYEVQPIPHTVTIAPDGTIHDVKVGYHPKAFELLRVQAEELLREDG